MKRHIQHVSPGLVVFLLIGSFLVMGLQRTNSGDPIQPTVASYPGVPWTSIGSITSLQASPAVTARDYSAMWTDLADANSIKWTVPNEAGKVEFRFSGQTNNQQNIVEVWLATGATMADGVTEEHFFLGAILDTTVGQQVGSHSNLFVDTISSTDYGLLGTIVLDSAADRMCIWQANLRGVKRVILIATTLNSNAFWADARWRP